MDNDNENSAVRPTASFDIKKVQERKVCFNPMYPILWLSFNKLLALMPQIFISDDSYSNVKDMTTYVWSGTETKAS